MRLFTAWSLRGACVCVCVCVRGAVRVCEAGDDQEHRAHDADGQRILVTFILYCNMKQKT